MRMAWQKWVSGLLALAMAVLLLAPAVWAEEGEEEAIRGTVLETMNSGGYTYIQLDRKGGKEWFAVPESLVKVGDEIQLQPGTPMGAYTSPTLKRTFDTITFSGGISGVLKRVVTAAEEKTDGQGTITVAKAEGPDAYTIEEVFAKKDALAGKKVVVRGKVVKTSQFDGKQWLRLVDGTGSSKRGNHKIVVITGQSAANDEIVTARGVVVTNKAFGALTYEVLLEDAQVEKQGK